MFLISLRTDHHTITEYNNHIEGSTWKYIVDIANSIVRKILNRYCNWRTTKQGSQSLLLNFCDLQIIMACTAVTCITSSPSSTSASSPSSQCGEIPACVAPPSSTCLPADTPACQGSVQSLFCLSADMLSRLIPLHCLYMLGNERTKELDS